MLSPGARTVLSFLLSKGAATSRGCWWRQKRIAEQTSMSVRSVQRHLVRLEELEIIRVQHRASTSNLYFADERAEQMGFSFRRNLSEGYAKLSHPSIELKLNTESAKPRSFSSEEIEHPRVQEALRKARSRIQRANNSEAYQAAIIRGELSRAGGTVACSTLAKESHESVSGEMAGRFFSPSRNQRDTLLQPLEAPTRFDVSRETVSRFVRDEDLAGLDDFIAQHEGNQASKSPDSAPIDDSVKTHDNIMPFCSNPEVSDVQPMQRPRILRRSPGRALCRAVEVLQLPGWLRGSEQHARSG